MKKLLLLCLLTLPAFVSAQTIISGIEGLVFSQKPESYQIQLKDSFVLHKMNLIPIDLTLVWDVGSKTFGLSGAARITTIQKEKLYVSFGTTDTPGIIIRNGILENVNALITATFGLKGISVKPKPLSLLWTKSLQNYSVFGSASVVVEKDSINASLGDAANPGIKITNGKIDQINIGISGKFTLKSLTMTPKGLTFRYDTARTGGSYQIFGGIKAKIETDSLDAVLGDATNPGIKITNGKIDHINIGVTTKFTLKSLSIQPKNLTFKYDTARTGGSYQIFGGIKAKIETDSLDAVLGDSTNPGIKISNGKIDHINIGVTTKFTLKALSIQPKGLTFKYDTARTGGSYQIFGGIKAKIETDSLDAVLGNSTLPGIEIIDGKVYRFEIGVTGNFKLKNLAIHTDTLGISWQKANNDHVFHLYGSARIVIKNDSVRFSFGNSSNPGVIITNGTMTAFNIATSADLHFGGLEVATRNFSVVHTGNVYQVNGKLLVKELWKAEVDLGPAGITLTTDNGKTDFQLNDVRFDLGNIDLGPVTVKDIDLVIKNNVVADDSISIEFPPGWDVAANLKFKSGKLDAIAIDWETESIKNAIEIPGTGAFIIKMAGGVNNLQDPHNFYFQGDIALAIGGPFNIKGVGDVSLLYLHASAFISRTEFILKADAKMGAYLKDGNWIPVLGDGTLKLDLKWGDYYSIAGSLNIPSYPYTILLAALEAKLTQGGAINAHIGVVLQMPPKIPVIGGVKFAKAEGTIHYDKTDPTSYAAGWAQLNLGFYTWNGGMKYNFQTKNYSTLGLKQITDLSNASYPAPVQNKTYWEYFHTTVDDDRPHYLQVSIKLKQKLSFSVDVLNPVSPGAMNYTPIYAISGAAQFSPLGITASTINSYNQIKATNTDSLVFYIMAPGYTSSSKALLPAAQYTVELSNTVAPNMILSHEVHKIFDSPTIFCTELDEVTHKDSNLPYISTHRASFSFLCSSYNHDSTTVSVFYTKKKNESGILIGSGPLKELCQNCEDDNVNIQFNNLKLPENLFLQDSIYFYSKIDDGINSAKSAYINVLKYFRDYVTLGGKIQIEGQPDSLASGIELSMWRYCSWVDPFGANHPLDYYRLNQKRYYTSSQGIFGFPYILNGDPYKLKIDIPIGYEIHPDSPIKPDQPYYLKYPFNVTVLLRRSKTS